MTARSIISRALHSFAQRHRIFIARSLVILCFAQSMFSQSFSARDLQVKGQSEFLFTQVENCYTLELPGIEPGAVQLQLPELPLGTRFISSKKEEYADSQGKRGTLISFWFTFSDSGLTRLSPLLVRINGKSHYIDFEQVMVHENPALITPEMEIVFNRPNSYGFDKKTGRKTITARKGEKISFTARIRYCVQVQNFKWTIPKDSIFTEVERFDFAKGTQKSTEFSDEPKTLARFEWQILKEGVYELPQISVKALSYNGSQKILQPAQNTVIIVAGKTDTSADINKTSGSELFTAAFEKPEDAYNSEKKSAPNREECAKIAAGEKRTFFQKLFGRHYAIFTGGQVTSVPEEKTNGQTFTGGQKVKITAQAGDWTFIENDEFSGWVKTEAVIEIQ